MDHPRLVRGWFGDLQLVDLSGGVLTIQTTSPAERDYIESECSRAFADAAQRVLGRFVTINVIAAAPKTRDENDSSRVPIHTPANLGADYTFGTFVKAPSNDLALAAARAAADEPGEHYNPLFLFGESGTGKTHLLQAICHQLKQSRPDAHVVFLAARDFMALCLNAFEHDEIDRLREHLRSATLFCLDDLQDLAGNERSLDEFFHTFDALHKAGQQIVVAADRPASDLAGMPDRILTRLGVGLVAPMEHPSRETRVSILAARAKNDCIDLPAEVAEFLADRFAEHLPNLIDALNRVNELARSQGARIDLSLAKRALDPADASKIPVAVIIDVVASRFEVAASDLISKSRARRVALARDAGIFLARRLTHLSLEQVGEVFGGRNHLQVLETAQAFRTRLDDDPDLAKMLDEIAQEAKNAAC